MSILNTLVERARKGAKVIVLPEGQDARVVAAANKAVDEKVVTKAIVLGSEAEIAEACAKAGVTERKFECVDYLNSPLYNDFVAEFTEMRKAKGMTPEKAAKTMQSRIYFGAMMCRRGLADGLVAGSIASTADMLRARVPLHRHRAGHEDRQQHFRDGPEDPGPGRRRCAAFRRLWRESESGCEPAGRHRARDLQYLSRIARQDSESRVPVLLDQGQRRP